MDCPRCGSFCSVLDEKCACGYDLKAERDAAQSATDASAEGAPPKKKKKKKRRKKQPMPEPEGVSSDLHHGHTQGVLALFFLNMISCGIYGVYWYLMRQPFLDSLGSHAKVGRSMPTFVIVGSVINLGGVMLALLLQGDPELASGVEILSRLVGFAASIASLILAFKVRSILLDHTKRFEPGYSVSILATFFFNVLYLQYKINRMTVRANIDDIVQEFA